MNSALPAAAAGASPQALALLESTDWSATPLGPRERWSGSLRAAVSICLCSRFPMFVWWGAGLVNLYNDAYARLLGGRHPRAFGRPAQTVWPEIWDTVGAQADRVMRAGESTWNERVLLAIERNGFVEDAWFTWSYSPLLDDDGSIGGVFCACQEDTPRVLAERERDALLEAAGRDLARREREQARNRFVIALDEAVRPLADPAHITATCARLLCEHLGANRCAYAEVLDDEDTFDLTGDHNRGVPSIVGRYRFADFGQEVLALMRAGRPYVVHDVDTHDPPIGDLGAYRLTKIRAVVCVPLVKGGRFVAAMAVHQAEPRRWHDEETELVLHVTTRCLESIEHARAQRRLRESEQRFRIAALVAASIVWTHDAEGRMVGEQAGWQAFTGQSREACQGDGWTDAVHPDDSAATLRAWQAAVAAHSQFVHRHRIRRADGEWRTCEVRALPLPGERGSVREWVGVHTDITERLALNEQLRQSLAAEQAARSEAERASRMKDEFLATLSHELRTPLSAILGWVALLRRRGELTAEAERGITVIERNARAQSQIIADLLDMSAIVSGKVRLEMNTVDLQTFVALAVETARPLAATKGVAIHCHFDAGRRLDVLGDANRLQQIPWNLLSNAIKFTPAGGRIDVGLAVDGQQVVLEVRDNGEGISPAFLPFLFDRFRQADASTTRTYGGLGLGLSIVKKLVEMHHGSVSADSAGPGCGASFAVRLPLAAGWDLPSDFGQPLPDLAAPRAPERAIANGEALQGLRVLLVDDDADGRETTQRLLEHRGVVVTPAGSAAEALSAVEAAAFDAVISDIGMPQVDGYGLMRELRAGEARRSGAPIAAIALTAYARPEDKAKAIEAGFDLHLAKPVDPARLYAALATAGARLTGRR